MPRRATPRLANYYAGAGYSVTQSTSYSSTQNYLTPAGSFTDSSSYFGTFDQSGDVLDLTASDDDSPVVRGGGWDNFASDLTSSYRDFVQPTQGGDDIGFRVVSVASIPEPSSMMLIGMVIAGAALIRRKV